MDDNDKNDAASNKNELCGRNEKKSTTLLRQGNEIYLPELAEIIPGSTEERQIIEEIVPPEIRGGLNADAAARHRKYSNLQKLLICGLVLLVLSAVYWFWPHPTALPTPEIPDSNLKQNSNAAIFEKARKLFKEEKYRQCVQILHSAVHAAVNDANTLKSNGQLLHLYFSSLWKSGGEVSTAAEIARLACALEPDALCWQLFKYEFTFPECFRKTVAGRDFDFPKEQETSQLLKKILADEFPRLKELKIYRENPDVKRVIDLFEAQMEFGVWLYYGTYEDDKDDYGVMNRENANNIAKKHPRSKEFLQLRINIVKTMLKKGVSGFYYYDGEELYLQRHLENKLKKLENAMQNLSR